MMLDIHRKYLDRLANTLSGMGAKYAIVIDGEKFGDLEVVEPKAKRKHTNPRKDYSQFQIRERMSNLQVGEVIVFKVDANSGFTVEDVRGNASAYACTKFGKGSCTTAISGDEVQILREF